jgi:parallel beta-helix repeat protein
MDMKNARMVWMLMLVTFLSLFPMSTGFVIETQHLPLSKRIITVDDEPGDADYTSIKEALENASPGDTIEVFSGTYYENYILINKEGISLIGIPHELGNGSETGKPFIDGQGINTILQVMARNVTVIGFRMENGGGQAELAIIFADNCTFSDNDLRYSENAVLGCGGNYCKIINNTISYSSMRQGILLWGEHILVFNNSISNVTEGISIWGASNCTYTENMISHCYDYGIVIYGTGYITVSHNTIEDNPTGILIDASPRNLIDKNNFINNTQQAFFNQGLGLTAGNHWTQNYWGRPRLLPYPIHGIVLIFVPWIQFDWRPALKPYDIS